MLRPAIDRAQSIGATGPALPVRFATALALLKAAQHRSQLVHMGGALGQSRGLDAQRREGLIRRGAGFPFAAKLLFQGGDALIALIGHGLSPPGIASGLLMSLALGLQRIPALLRSVRSRPVSRRAPWQSPRAAW